jgi:2-polyprenyl-3-methyl-5-hydroxy-6-metoxy-1,4-benzoquinol methylase
MTPETQTQAPPSPALFFETLNAYQRSEAMKSAIELGLFSKIAAGNVTSGDIATACAASERGVRILCDYLVVIGFLTKQDSKYGLTPDTAMFLDERSPAFQGSAIGFLLDPRMIEHFKNLTAAVKKGGSVAEEGTVGPEDPVWVEFARAMAPMMALPAQLLAQLVDPNANTKLKILDIAAGHGLYGIAFTKRNPQAEVTAVDWASVLEVATENAQKAGVADRHQTKPGSAFDVDYGEGYDLVLLTNFLHHFDQPTCEALLRKVRASLADNGRAVILEFIPNDDRVSPPMAAAFSLIMLGSTPAGDAYTFKEFDTMARNAGFSRSEFHELTPSIQRVVISHK